MARNSKLELDAVGLGRWMTADGRFGVFKRNKAINPMEATVDFKIKPEYSIHSFEDYNGPKQFIELAPEVGRVDTFNQVFPWIGQYTGEGSFEKGVPDRVTAKPMGGSRKVEEALEFLSDVFTQELTEEEWKLGKKWLTGVKAWWKQWVAKGQRFANASGKQAGEEALAYFQDGSERLRKLRQDLWFNKGLWPQFATGDEKKDRKHDQVMPTNNVAWDLEQAEKALGDIESRVKVSLNAVHVPSSSEATYYQGMSDKRYGKARDKDALDAELEQIPESVKKVDDIISGKLFRRLNAFHNKWNPVGDQMDPLKDRDYKTEVSLGRMKLVFVPVKSKEIDVDILTRFKDKVRSPAEFKWYIKAFKEAQRKMDRAGFKKLWYGVSWIMPEKEARDFKSPRTGKTRRSAAHWTWSDDVVVFSDIARNHASVVSSIAHELGHRWYYKFMKRGDRLRFNSYFGDVPAVREYGSESPSEDFATVFEAYIMGQDLTPDQRERFKQFAIRGKGIRRHEDVVRMRDSLVG